MYLLCIFSQFNNGSYKEKLETEIKIIKNLFF